jgi:membrane-bound lytic murein transglycosylase B
MKNVALQNPRHELENMLKQNPLFTKKFLRDVLSNPEINTEQPKIHDVCVTFLKNYNDTFELRGARSLELGREFYKLHKKIFAQVHSKYGVKAEYILAILRVETYFGTCTGQYRVLPRLYHLYKNVQNKKEFAIREIEAFLELVVEYGWDPFKVHGSAMGAMGISQFLPSSIKNFAVDGNGDGKINMFEVEDVIPSVAHYLVVNHFKVSKRAGIWNYNRSTTYVKNVLAYAKKIAKKIN